MSTEKIIAEIEEMQQMVKELHTIFNRTNELLASAHAQNANLIQQNKELRERVRQLEKERLYQALYTPQPVSPLGCPHERWTTIAMLNIHGSVEHKRQCLACKSIF